MLILAMSALFAGDVSRVPALEALAPVGEVRGAVLNERGALIGLSGTFPLNCDPADPEELRAAILGFVNQEANHFLVASYVSEQNLRLVQASADGDLIFVEGEQLQDGLPIVGGDVVFVIDGACNLVTFNGSFIMDGHAPALRARPRSEIAHHALCEAASSETWPMASEFVSLREVFIPERGPGQEYVTTNYTCLVDGAGEIVDLRSAWRTDYVSDNASVTRGNYTATALDSRSAFTASTISVGRNDFFGNCTWELSYFFTPAPLDRVQYEPGDETQVSGNCSTTNPVFGSASRWAAGFRQQEAYYSLRMARSYAYTYMWNVFSATQAGNDAVKANLDMGWPYCSPACYNTALTDIFTRERDDSNNMFDHRIDRFAHEYGHHVVHTYGGMAGNSCTPTNSQGDGIHETMGDTMAMITMINRFSASYTASWLRIGISGERHSGGSTPVTYNCNTSTPLYQRGQAFEHAIWEIMHNHDCSFLGQDCDLAFGNAINPCWTDLEASRMVARAVAYALKSTGATVSYAQIVNAIVYDLSVSQGTTCGTVPSQNADYVFQHHGL